ncbi:hypothetical protein A7Q09_06150 [Methylacidiphilum sp. Yel]|jgi:hypothetical protein|uniref:DUF3226 domain-containing protein n=1 Tax=Methylacidiphilum sp. Yel TaxID=1847730 RepID=UPI0010696BF2|nr:DUF3226 domain-containing protein [Methylacidiphilum sp. Yel]TFE69068.1 hypothetical protein A7Q09_06150 [Methylacidiphilum sp. Yel]
MNNQNNIPPIEKEDLLIICEGEADEVFLKKLGEKNQFNEYVVWSADGRDKFPEKFKAAIANFKDHKKSHLILFIADAGNEPNRTFKEIVNQLKKITKVSNFPKSCCKVASNKGYPAVKIHLLPDCNEPGALETLCYSVMKENQQIAECIEKFANCTNTIKDWPIERRDKAYVQCFIASTNQEDPNKSLRFYLTNTSFKFDHDALKPLVKVIKNSLMAAKEQANG